MALDHELRLLEGLALQVIDVDTPICFLLRHHGRVRPCKEVHGALVSRNFGIQRAQFEAIEFRIDHDGRVSLDWSLLLESSLNAYGGLAEVAVFVDFDLIRVFLRVTVGDQSQTELLVWSEDDALHAF